jgi:uncharacterized protein
MEPASETLPRIWFDASMPGGIAGEEGFGRDDCECNCDYPCRPLNDPHYAVPPYLTPRSLLVQPRLLHTQPLADDHWLVADPLGRGAVAVLDPSARLIFERFRTRSSVEQVVRSLPQWDEDAILALVTQLAQLGLLCEEENAPPPPRTCADTLVAWLHITNRCPSRCQYCYLTKTDEHMDLATAYASVDAVIRSARLNQFRAVKLKYAGGEAATQIDTVFAAHDYALVQTREADLSLEAVLLSGGVGLGPRAIAGLKARGIRLMLSLDGLGANHDAQRPLANGGASFATVDRTLRYAQASGLAPHISVTLAAHNLAGLPELITYLLDLDLAFSINYYRESAAVARPEGLLYAEEEMILAMRAAFAVLEARLPARSLLGCLLDRADLRLPHQLPCGVGANYLVISQRGEVAKCQMEIERAITMIAAVDPLSTLRNDRDGLINLPVDEREGCCDCLWRYWCGGGCPSLTFRHTGRYNTRSPNCTIYAELYPNVLRLEGLRLLAHTAPWVPEPAAAL